MPANYAHYRFGVELISKLPPEIQRTVNRFRQLFDMGLHGPDILNYHDPLIKTPTVRLCDKLHAQTGQVFFERTCRVVRMNPSEGARAYLYGLLAHYCLDSLSAGRVIRISEEKELSRGKIGGEFDRFLLELDGKTPAHRFDMSAHVQLTPGECQTVALFYPNVGSSGIGRCVKRMASCIKLQSGAPRSRWQMLTGAADRLAPRVAEIAVPTRPLHPLNKNNPELLRLYELAQARYLHLLEQLRSHLRRKTPLGPDFSLPFR